MNKIPIRQITSAHKEEATSERFSVRKTQDLLAGKDMVQKLHRHDFFFLLAIKNGSGLHEIDFTRYKFADNSIFLLRPGQVHQLDLKAGSTGYLIEFNSGFYHPTNKKSALRLRKASGKNFCQPDNKRFERLYALLTYIFQEYTDKQEGYREVIKSNLEIFFIEFVRQSQQTGNPSDTVTPYTQERLEEFLELLQANINTHKQVSQYTTLMNLSPYQLNEITKATIGKTSSAIINEHIILEAKRYLLATPGQVKDIADQLGYEDVSYFIRFFKKHTGYSPDAFRHKAG